nr:immunoglobulin heavy chain junction region [Mus musculus]
LCKRRWTGLVLRCL